MNGLGGSELYHHELLIGLSKFKDLEISVATITEPNLEYQLWQDIKKLGYKILRYSELTTNSWYKDYFDLMVVSQPQPNHILCQIAPNTPKISIIHSALRSEDAIKHHSIKHYISVQPDIYRCLKNQYGIKTKDISMIYNPIDDSRFRYYLKKKENYKLVGTLIGEINDPLRTPMIEHIVNECIRSNMELHIISNSKYDFNNDLIKVIDPCYNTENYVKRADFTVGIGGRTTIEGWLCGLPSYIYKVDPQGRILDIQLKYPPKTFRFNRDYVALQHYELYNKILNGK